jgi:hypothetical protein
VVVPAGFVWQTAENEWGHAVVATALSVVDDTALTGKTLLPELKVNGAMVLQLHCRRIRCNASIAAGTQYYNCRRLLLCAGLG